MYHVNCGINNSIQRTCREKDIRNNRDATVLYSSRVLHKQTPAMLSKVEENKKLSLIKNPHKYLYIKQGYKMMLMME